MLDESAELVGFDVVVEDMYESVEKRLLFCLNVGEDLVGEVDGIVCLFVAEEEGSNIILPKPLIRLFARLRCEYFVAFIHYVSV